MKQKVLNILARVGHFQAQLMLTLMFVLVVAPYALLLRLFGKARLPQGAWQRPESQPADLEHLRRTF